MKANPFLVNIAALRPTPGGRHHVVRAGRLDGLSVTSSAVPAGAEVVVDADVEVVAGGVVVTGTVSSTWEGECRRCLRSVTGELMAPFREVYERAARVREGDLGEADEAETYPLSGDTVDLVPLARDALLLELPMAPLCREDCVGLCPHCGADRSEQPCDCTDQPGHPVWAVLDSLRVSLDDGERAEGDGAGPGVAETSGEQGVDRA